VITKWKPRKGWRIWIYYGDNLWREVAEVEFKKYIGGP
jgi:hypothetical protein